MGIKLQALIGIIITFLVIGSFLGILVEKSSAEEQRAEISIVGEPTYTLTNQVKKNNKIFGRTYLIKINLHNAGNKRSEELVVNITDGEGFSLEKHSYFSPRESKIVSFTWSTLLNRDQKITVNFFPSDLDAIWTQYNSGSKTFTIKIDDEDGLPATSTPGFEFVIVILAVIMYVFLDRKKRPN